MNFAQLLVVFIMIVTSGCADGGNADVRIKIDNTEYLIPQSYLSYADDFSGGNQATVTINAGYPEMGPAPRNKE